MDVITTRSLTKDASGTMARGRLACSIKGDHAILAATAQPTTEHFDLSSAASVQSNLSNAELVEQALAKGEGVLASNGALVSKTGKFTGRTPGDKATVREPSSEENIWWENNRELSPERFAALKEKVQGHLSNKHLYVVDAYGGADPKHRISVRVIVEKAWHALFIRTLLIRPDDQAIAGFSPEWTIIDASSMEADPATDGTVGKPFILLNFAEKLVMIGGTEYAGEMKKSVFTILNYLLPIKGVLSMHCSANIGVGGDTALFFGLSGTGKTTLSADPDRRLIGDDEHGWTDDGVFNFEGGCYAKCIRLSRKNEPQIWDAIRFGSVLENVVLDRHRNPLYDDGSITENTRVSYPVEFIPNAVIPSVGGHPKNICFLTADAFGVLPPISLLTEEQAMEQFLLGYTAKVAGTEAGVKEPQATFSTCFGAPFLPLRPKMYSDLLGQKMRQHGAKVWLINTGWTGGPYGVGKRMNIDHTRAMVRAALSGELDNVDYDEHEVFGFAMPTICADVPAEVLDPRNTWGDKAEYDVKAKQLKAMFDEQIAKFR
ncbi:MAG: phosphoenolpyruvate carboxykinase (ATP) [Armatimonadota bacterium]|nr:phosphoenolpyruvate carboxykinase (ATP) [Armatimonadota bacterium]